MIKEIRRGIPGPVTAIEGIRVVRMNGSGSESGCHRAAGHVNVVCFTTLARWWTEDLLHGVKFAGCSRHIVFLLEMLSKGRATFDSENEKISKAVTVVE